MKSLRRTMNSLTSPFTPLRSSRKAYQYDQVLFVETPLEDAMREVDGLAQDTIDMPTIIDECGKSAKGSKLTLYTFGIYTKVYNPRARATPRRAINPHSLIESAIHCDKP
jgi:hypothetical protein